jgi:hypothetical protein
MNVDCKILGEIPKGKSPPLRRRPRRIMMLKWISNSIRGCGMYSAVLGEDPGALRCKREGRGFNFK